MIVIMSKVKLFSGLLLSLFFSPLLVSAELTIFSDQLSWGVRSSKVRLLQLLLNSDYATRLVAQGPGSPGRETDYFGPLTSNALQRFQLKYLNELQTNQSNFVVSGKVDSATAQQLNKQLSIWLDNLKQVVLLSQQKIQSPIPANKPETTTNKISVVDKPTVTTKNNQSVDNLATWWSNSADLSPNNVFWPASPPRSNSMDIYSLSPTQGGPGTVITIKGRGFSTTANKIYSGYDIKHRQISADGQTLSLLVDLRFEPMGSSEGARQYASSTWPLVRQIPLGITVENDSGISNTMVFYYNY